ncbi:MAG: GGDEF domain-containing protein [Clostridium tyrobutyricum]|jgi:diguanylate cyclase (GGDEF)-like protein|uniref:GGDEF domain-containing protein n=1 Tax=Clostridium tyrobutyricum TaxID=1519 RepID=UPI00242F7541|nr:GGDEF domain-containing protein [Clostridium tyrobutyricum]MCH4200548.1 GGDEF domain-containing protein [Clostridium tyrobutyricum]MCH4237604.1 GGDEF domain-containing protein [Clostridium tyrobutyricum]MCH4259685.1 GGDEF domain-containing protein [Clostridium tyrobutyricum]
MKIIYLVFIIYSILSTLVIFKCFIDIKCLKDIAFSTKENNIIKDILDISLNSKEILTLEKSTNLIIKILKRYYRLDYCSILINKGRLIIAGTNVENKYLKSIEKYCSGQANKIDSIVGKIKTSETYLEYEFAEERKIKYSYLIPISKGAIYIENKDDYKENDFEVEFFKIVIKNIDLVLQNSIYHDKLTSLAMKDNLTKMYNRNYMQIHLKEQIDKGSQFVLGIMDIDHFKKFNDTYGHEFGDIVLIEASKFMKQDIRECDEIYRWGGEEFLLFFNNTTCEEIFTRLDSIRDSLSKLPLIKDDIKTNVTASFGICQFPYDAVTIDALIACADEALYKSKENGRNKVTIYAH